MNIRNLLSKWKLNKWSAPSSRLIPWSIINRTESGEFWRDFIHCAVEIFFFLCGNVALRIKDDPQHLQKFRPAKFSCHAVFRPCVTDNLKSCSFSFIDILLYCIT